MDTNNASSNEPSGAAPPFQSWRCQVCGWVYDEVEGSPVDGIPPGTRWANVPADWTCPQCGASKAEFQMIAV